MIPFAASDAIATGRQRSMFDADFRSRRADLEARLSGRRILVVGGAGSIGAATIRELFKFPLSALHVVDHNENGLAELSRDLRNQPEEVQIHDFRPLPIDFGSARMEGLLASQPSYDFVMNFAALKHVRSEKDAVSLLQMLDVNVLRPLKLLEWLNAQRSSRYFCVSTDKAANPVSLMGASKRLMELTAFSRYGPAAGMHVTSARFANVAFSSGSLLESFLIRLQKRQPIAVPADVRRFFVSLQEAGQICLLAAVCAPDRHILVPRLFPESHLIELETVAVSLLETFGLRPRVYRDEIAAKNALQADLSAGAYPVLVTPQDTSGEKPYEEFAGEDEHALEIGMEQLLGIDAPATVSDSVLAGVIERISKAVQVPSPSITKEAIAHCIAEAIPHFRHRETGKHLDDRM